MLRLNVRRWGSSHKSGQLEMTQSFDLVLTGATIVNHDGEGVGDLAIAGGRIAAIGSKPHAAFIRPSLVSACCTIGRASTRAL